MNQNNDSKPATVAATPIQAGEPAAKRSDRWGYRRCSGRIVPGALRQVDTLLKAGHDWVVDADLKSYFDTIPHERLLALVTERVGDGRVLALVESFLRAGVMEEAKGWQPTGEARPKAASSARCWRTFISTRSTIRWKRRGGRWCVTQMTS